MRRPASPWLQILGTHTTVRVSVMNDFPIQEDRPVEPTARYIFAASLSETTEYELRILRFRESHPASKASGQQRVSADHFFVSQPNNESSHE